MFNPSRHDARRFFFNTWNKQQVGQLLSDLEQVVFAVLLAHPEYHPILEHPEKYLEKDWTSATAESNPFLHMSLHIALEEQRAIDQPFGIRSLYAQLALQLGSEHAAQHTIMDCLADTISHAQHYGNEPDANRYLNAIRQRAGIES